MKNISSALESHLAGEVTTLATCWKVTRRDAVVMGFTDHVSDLTVDGVTYRASSGFLPGAIHATASLAVDRLEAEGMLSDDAITEADIMAGLYDFAEVEVFAVNYADLGQGVLRLRTGWLGEVKLEKGAFVAEVRGLVQKLSQPVGALYGPTCRAVFGDSRCGYNAATVTHSGTATASSARHVFSDSARTQPSGYFSFGQVTFTSGANTGLSMEVKEYRNKQFTLALPMPYSIAPGDAYSVVAGCDKTFKTCITTYNNAVNFRGEPHVPGIDKVLETAGTRS